MRTLIDSESSERSFEGLRAESESVSANIIYRASSALYEALRLSFDVLFLPETQQCKKFYNGMLQNF